MRGFNTFSPIDYSVYTVLIIIVSSAHVWQSGLWGRDDPDRVGKPLRFIAETMLFSGEWGWERGRMFLLWGRGHVPASHLLPSRKEERNVRVQNSGIAAHAWHTGRF